MQRGKALFKTVVTGTINGFDTPGEVLQGGGMFGEASSGNMDGDINIPAGKYSKMVQVNVEVYQTLMIKCLRYNVITDNILMVGTMIQRCVNDPRITIDQVGFYR